MKSSEKIIKYVNDIKNGSKEAFAGLYEESYKYLHTCVIHIVKDEEVAQDMLQETYIEIFKNISQLKSTEDFMSWAATIANRKCFAYLKKKKDILVDEPVDDEGNTSDFFENIADNEGFIPENIFDNIEKINLIRGIIDELTDVQRACVIGFYYNEQKQDQIAEQLGIPVNTVKSHLNRAKAKIKEAVGNIEKKQGIKLFSIIPFMFALFKFETEAYAAECVVPVMSSSVADVMVAKDSIPAGTVTAKATGATVKSAGMALKTKLAIVAIVGVLGIGAVAGAVILNKMAENTDAAVEETGEEISEEISEGISEDTWESNEMIAEESNSSGDDANKNDFIIYVDAELNYDAVLDLVSICGMPLSTISGDNLAEYFEKKASEYYDGIVYVLRDDAQAVNKTYTVSKEKFMDEYTDYENSSHGYTFENEIMFSYRDKNDNGSKWSELWALQDDQYNISWLIYEDGNEYLAVTDNESGRGKKSDFNLFINKAKGLTCLEFTNLVYPGASEMFDSGIREIVFNNGFMTEAGHIYFEKGTVDKHFDHIVPSCTFNDNGDYLITGIRFECIDKEQLNLLDLRKK